MTEINLGKILFDMYFEFLAQAFKEEGFMTHTAASH